MFGTSPFAPADFDCSIIRKSTFSLGWPVSFFLIELPKISYSFQILFKLRRRLKDVPNQNLIILFKLELKLLHFPHVRRRLKDVSNQN